MVISYQLSTQQRHETASFCHSMYRLIFFAVFCGFLSCDAYVLFWMVMLHVYYIRSKVSNSMYSSVVKNLVFNQNIEIESQHFEFRN